MDERRLGSAFQRFEATDENDLEFAKVVLRGGTHIDNDDEEPSLYKVFQIKIKSNQITVYGNRKSITILKSRESNFHTVVH